MTHKSDHAVVAAFAEDQTSRLTGVSVQQLRYWDKTALFSPKFGTHDGKDGTNRVYSFEDVAALRVLYVLTKTYSISVQHLRDVSKKLAALNNGAWARTTLYVLNGRVNFDDPTDGRQREVVSGQYAIGIPLEKIVSDTRRDIAALSTRGTDQVGKIQRKRNVSHNLPVIAGTRVPVRAIKRFHEDGYSIEQIIAEYPALIREDILAAIAFDQSAKAA